MTPSITKNGFGHVSPAKKKGADPQHRKLYSNHVKPLLQGGQLAEVEPILRLLIQSRTQLPEVYRDLAALEEQRGNLEAARRLRITWLEIDSPSAEQRFEQGLIAESLGLLPQALEHYQQVLNLEPLHSGGLAKASESLLRLERWRDALEIAIRWSEHQHDSLEAHVSKTLCLLELSRWSDAQVALQSAQSLKKVEQQAGWLAVLQAIQARLLQKNGQEQAALNLALQVMDLPEPCWPLHAVLAPLLMEQQQLCLLEHVLTAALEHQPDSARLHAIRAEALLLAGRIQSGYAALDRAHQLRQAHSETPPHGCTLPRHQPGEEIEPLALIAGDTLGDTLCLSRYAPWLQQRRQGRVTLYVQPPLLQLLRLTLPGDLDIKPLSALHNQTKGTYLTLRAVPGIYGSCKEHNVLTHPHLNLHSKIQDVWRERLQLGSNERLIGVNWHGSALQAISEHHNGDIPLQLFKPLSQIEGVLLVSLQKGVGSEQLQRCDFQHRFVKVQDEISREMRLEHMAAIISLCDAVVCDDSGPAHLTGCLGKSGYVLLPERINWRWAPDDRGGNPWYPSLKLIRKQVNQDWEHLVQHAVNGLQQQ